MNHWFLVGRDIMWFVLVMFPLVGMSIFGYILGETPEMDEETAFIGGVLSMLSIGVYAFLLLGLYFGWIR